MSSRYRVKVGVRSIDTQAALYSISNSSPGLQFFHNWACPFQHCTALPCTAHQKVRPALGGGRFASHGLVRSEGLGASELNGDPPCACRIEYLERPTFSTLIRVGTCSIILIIISVSFVFLTFSTAVL